MNLRDIVDLQLDSFFGSRFPWKIQELVDSELNNGRWLDGYDIAVSSEVISILEAQQLLEIILNESPRFRLDKSVLLPIVDECLPQSCMAQVSWIVDEVGSFALSDTLRVARFDMGRLSWVSSRISLDGIEFDSLDGGKLKGRSWLGSNTIKPDSPFEIDFDSGELLVGEGIPC